METLRSPKPPEFTTDLITGVRATQGFQPLSEKPIQPWLRGQSEGLWIKGIQWILGIWIFKKPFEG